LQYRLAEAARQLILAVGRRYSAGTDRLAAALETAALLRDQTADQAAGRLAELHPARAGPPPCAGPARCLIPRVRTRLLAASGLMIPCPISRPGMDLQVGSAFRHNGWPGDEARQNRGMSR
jgi:hypothetical protein